MNLIHKSHKGARQQPRFVITGMGGQGKSEICLHIVWGVFWADISSPSVAKRSFSTVAKSLGFSVDDVDGVRQLISNLKRTWLLILDGADYPEFDYQVYFPSGDGGTIIMTSRVSNCSQYQTIGSETLAGLKKKECVELLLKVAEIPLASWPPHERAAENVVNDLSSHTLAVLQAGAFVARGHCSMEEYPGKFRKQRTRLLQFRPKQAKSRYSDVFTTFEASASVLKESESLEAKDALRLLEVG